MKILILHRIPYAKIKYALGIDHARHDVTYVGTKLALSNIPEDLRCQKIERAGLYAPAIEILELFENGQFIDGSPDHVISLSEYELLDAARIREALGVPGASVDDVLLVRDKVLMKNAVQAAGLRAPLHLECQTLTSLESEPWHGPTVLKPRDGASSENILIYSSFADAQQAIHSEQTGISSFDPFKFELEEYVEGPILHIDGLVVHGELICWLPSRYVGTCLDYAQGEPLGSVQFAPNADLRSWTERILNAVNIREGSFHLEAIESADGLVFLEVANRVGGADVVDTFEMATGVYLPAAELSARIGDLHLYDPRKSFHEPTKSFGWFVFPGHQLQAGYPEISGLQAFESHSNMVRIQKLESRPLPRQITYQSVDVPIAGVAAASNAEELDSWMRELFATVEVRSISLPAARIEEVVCHA